LRQLISRFYLWSLPDCSELDYSEIQRVHILATILLATQVLALFALCAFALFGFYDVISTAIAIIGTLSASSLVTIALFVCRRGHTLLAGQIFITTIYLASVYGTSFSGGYSVSPALQIIYVVPLYGFLLGGVHSGLFWTFLSVTTKITFFYLAHIGVEFRQITPFPGLVDPIDLFVWVLVIALCATALFSYEIINRRLTFALAKEKEHFEHRAAHDALTGLGNRARFDAELSNEYINALHSEIGFALVYIDLNKFKLINDTYGHTVGDQVLIAVAERIKSTLRRNDLVARLGGDEFAVILTGVSSLQDTLKIIEKLSSELHFELHMDAGSLLVSCSIGIAVYPQHTSILDELLKFADDAMYVSKNNRLPYYMYGEKIEKPPAATNSGNILPIRKA
jgi:diguanylate cyclase (GGDEF)-like protein